MPTWVDEDQYNAFRDWQRKRERRQQEDAGVQADPFWRAAQQAAVAPEPEPAYAPPPPPEPAQSPAMPLDWQQPPSIPDTSQYLAGLREASKTGFAPTPDAGPQAGPSPWQFAQDLPNRLRPKLSPAFEVVPETGTPADVSTPLKEAQVKAIQDAMRFRGQTIARDTPYVAPKRSNLIDALSAVGTAGGLYSAGVTAPLAEMVARGGEEKPLPTGLAMPPTGLPEGLTGPPLPSLRRGPEAFVPEALSSPDAWQSAGKSWAARPEGSAVGIKGLWEAGLDPMNIPLGGAARGIGLLGKGAAKLAAKEAAKLALEKAAGSAASKLAQITKDIAAAQRLARIDPQNAAIWANVEHKAVTEGLSILDAQRAARAAPQLPRGPSLIDKAGSAAHRGLQAANEAITNPALRDIAPGLGIKAVEEAPNIAQPFYSALQRTIESAKAPNRATAEQWRGFINAQGVKPDEVRWVGVDDFLNARQGKPVTKQELADYVAANQVQLEEVTKRAGLTDAQQSEFTRLGFADQLSVEQEARYQELKAQAASPAKFSQYTLPGGENYREVLLTLPMREETVQLGKPELFNGTGRAFYEGQRPVEGVQTWPFTIAGEGGRITYWPETFNWKGESQSGKYIVDAPHMQNAQFDTLEQATGAINKSAQDTDARAFAIGSQRKDVYQSGHWDEPNVLAHVRFNDRVTPDGKKTLFIEEIQSDWHQAGRQKGYAKDTKGWTAQLLSKPDAGFNHWQINDADGNYVTRIVGGNKEGAIQKAAEGIPAAPFAKTWPELAFKRVVKFASDNGYDSVSWTTGGQQAERYDLAKQVSSLVYDPQTQQLTAYGTSMRQGRALEVLSETTPPEKLPDYVGKDVARKLLQEPTKVEAGGAHVLSGIDLQVGGQGMVGFYDQILPEVANKFGKKFGARVGETSVQTRKPSYIIFDRNGHEVSGGYDTLEQAQALAEPGDTIRRWGEETVHSLPITGAMRQTARSQGFALFTNPETVSGAAGTAYGYATAPEDMTPEERMQRGLQFGIGAAAGTGVLRGGLGGLRKIAPGGTIEQVGTRRFYHGTGSAFDVPDAGKFDPNGLYGPGYYLTSSPEVAGGIVSEAGDVAAKGYAQRAAGTPHYADDVLKARREVLRTRQEQYNTMTQLNPDLSQSIKDDLLRSIEGAKADLAEAQALYQGAGQQVRPVNVPENLRLLDADAPLPWRADTKVSNLLTPSQRDDFYNTLIKLQDSQQLTSGDALFKALVKVGGGNGKYPAEVLQAAGYDGIRYQGGKRIPMKDAAGNPIEHEAVVIFPESLPKITNALSGLPMGSPPEVGAALVGGVTAYDPNKPLDQQDWSTIAARAATGGLGMHLARRGMVGGTIEDVGKGLDPLTTAPEGSLSRAFAGAEQLPKGAQPVQASLPVNPDIARYEALNTRYMDVQERLVQLEDDIYAKQFERQGRSEDLGIQRPPWGVGWTDAELSEIAGRSGLNPAHADWWDSVDQAALADYNPMRQGGGKTKALRQLSSDVASLTAERTRLLAESKGLESGMTAALEGAKPSRAPIWEGKTGSEPPLRGGPPAPPIEPPAEGLPSGRTPGGPGRMKPGKPVDSYQQLVDALTPDKVPTRSAIQNATDTFLRAMYDRVWNAHTIEDATKIPVHKLAQIVPGAISYGEHLVDSQVMPVLQSVGKDVQYLEQYMVGRRFEDLLARNPQAKLPGKVEGWAGTLDAMAGLKGKIGPERYAAVEDAAQELWRLNDELVLKPRLEAGLLSKEQYTQIRSANPHYVSFYREDFAGLQTGLSKGEANVTNAGIQAMDLGGSSRKLDNPLARFNAQVINTQHLIAENNAAKAMVTGLLDMEKTGAAKGAAKAPLTRTGESFARIVRPGDKVEDTKVWGTVSYLQDGQKITAQVPKVYADMAKGLESESANFVIKLARVATTPLRAGAITWNIAFMPKNVIRDLISASFREGMQPVSKDYAGGWLAAIAKNSDFEDAAKAGALMSGIVENMRSTNALARASQMGAITVNSPKDALLLVPRIIGRGLGAIERAGVISEQATRIATYKKLRGQGLSELDAAIRARDVTVDFAKAGNIMKVFNQIVPFTNAGVQGAANTLRTMRYNPKQAVIGAAPLAAATVLAWANNQRYETSKMIPEREYAMNWIFQFGEGTKAADPRYPNKPAEKFPIYLRIPKGQIGALLTAPIETGLRYAWANNDRSVLNDVGAALSTMATSLSPVEPSISGILPPLASTIVGMQAGPGGWDAFRNQPIVPRAEQDRPKELQFGPETSKIAVALGEQFHVSPRLIDFAIKDTAAGLASQTLWLSDLILGAVGYDPSVYGEARKQPLSDTQQLAKAPITGGFLGVQNTEANNKGWDAFDKAVEESQRAAAASPEMRRLGVTIGRVSDKASVGDFSIVLTPLERSELQDVTTKVLVGLVPKVMQNPSYQRVPDALKVKALQAVMDKGREAARNAYLKKIPKDTMRQRIEESLPVPVGGGR